MTPAAKRRWFRFSVAMMFVATILVAAGCWFAVRNYHLRARQSFLEELFARNAAIEVYTSYPTFGETQPLGSKPIDRIIARNGTINSAERQKLERLFPEAIVTSE